MIRLRHCVRKPIFEIMSTSRTERLDASRVLNNLDFSKVSRFGRIIMEN